MEDELNYKEEYEQLLVKFNEVKNMEHRSYQKGYSKGIGTGIICTLALIAFLSIPLLIN